MGTFLTGRFGAEAEDRVGFKVAAWFFSLPACFAAHNNQNGRRFAPSFAI